MKELEFTISPNKLTLADVKKILAENLKLKLSNIFSLDLGYI